MFSASEMAWKKVIELFFSVYLLLQLVFLWPSIIWKAVWVSCGLTSTCAVCSLFPLNYSGSAHRSLFPSSLHDPHTGRTLALDRYTREDGLREIGSAYTATIEVYRGLGWHLDFSKSKLCVSILPHFCHSCIPSIAHRSSRKECWRPAVNKNVLREKIWDQ